MRSTFYISTVSAFSRASMDRYLGDPLFDPVFDELNRRKAVVFIHPTHCETPTETNLGAPPFVVEYVFDTTRAIVNLIFTGTLKRVPMSASASRTGVAQCRFSPEESQCSKGTGRPKESPTLFPRSGLCITRSPAPPGIRAAFTARSRRPNAYTLGFGPAFRLRRAAAGGSGSLGGV